MTTYQARQETQKDRLVRTCKAHKFLPSNACLQGTKRRAKFATALMKTTSYFRAWFFSPRVSRSLHSCAMHPVQNKCSTPVSLLLKIQQEYHR